MARVLVITPSFPPRVGGVEKHVWQTSRLPGQAGWKVAVLTEQFAGLPQEERQNGLRIFRFAYPKRKLLGLLVIWWTLFRRYLWLFREADVIHIHDVFVWYLPLRVVLWRKPVVTTFHGWEGVYPVPHKNIIIRRLSAWLSHRTIAVGRYVEKYYHFRADQVIYAAADIPQTPAKKENLLLYVGRLSEDTGVSILLDALKAGAWQGKIIFCGDGPLRKLAEQVGTVTGFRDSKPFLKKARVVFAGGYLSVAEAFAFRRPVLVAALNPLKQDYYLLSPFAQWLTVVSSSDQVKQALWQLARPDRRAKAMQQAAYQWVKQQTWKAISDGYIRFYKQLLYK